MDLRSDIDNIHKTFNKLPDRTSGFSGSFNEDLSAFIHSFFHPFKLLRKFHRADNNPISGFEDLNTYVSPPGFVNVLFRKFENGDTVKFRAGFKISRLDFPDFIRIIGYVYTHGLFLSFNEPYQQDFRMSRDAS